MSFAYGGVDTADLPGVTATLSVWPSLGGLSVQTSEIPGSDGVSFGGQSRSSIEFEFEVDITGGSPAEVFDRRDHFISVIDPSRGPRSLIVEREADWLYPDVLASSDIEWERVVWRDGLGLILRGAVRFRTVGIAAAREIDPAVHSGTGSVTYVQPGNTASRPSVEIPSGGDIRIQIGNDFELDLTGTPADLTAVLSWDEFSFYLRDDSGKRVESLVPYMSHYEAPTVLPGQEVTVHAGQLAQVTYEWAGVPHESESIKKINAEVARNIMPNPRGHATDGNVVVVENHSGSSSPDPDLRLVNGNLVGPKPQGTRISGSGGQVYWSESRDSYALRANGTGHASILFSGTAYTGWVATHVDVFETTATGPRSVRVRYDYAQTTWSTETFPTVLKNTEQGGGSSLYFQVNDPLEGEMYYFRILLAEGSTESKALAQVETYFDGDTQGGTETLDKQFTVYPNSRRI